MAMDWTNLSLDDDEMSLSAALALLDEPLDDDALASMELLVCDDTDASHGESDASSLETELVDTLGRVTQASPASTETTSSPEPSIPRGTRPTDSTVVRRRHEILYLHDKVLEMEELLRGMKRQRTEALVAASVVWHDLAVRQQQQRQSAELENARLRNVLQTQVQVGKDLLQALQHSCKHASKSRKAIQHPRPRWYETSDERMLAPMEALYAETPSVFRSPKFAFDARPFRDFKVVEVVDNAATLLLQANWVFPFAFDRVLPAFWQAATQQRAQEYAQLYPSTLDSDNTMVSVFNSNTKTANPSAVSAIHGKLAIKRFCDDPSSGPAVFTSHMHADLTTADAVPVDSDVTLCGVAWIRIQAIPLDGAAGALAMTQVQISRRLSLEIFDDAEVPQQHVGALTHCVLSQIEAELVWKQQAIENLLFGLTKAE
ncbi:hypothetical protein Poli38472_004910 [Pythium oligandrum]|uniref:Uncharacterized protein n=1 Tax=Pythium oligandrum TaxID=41045 RepID=A0A8K1CAQ1_PYTOL|nr:hypothetical protein Poli38472_004910 [Pythium oligandrum]|eukprot:TMW59841.1 hypothetical protein Poli38472_004910 [Pythium oligandrum]